MGVVWASVGEIQGFGGERYRDGCGVGECGRDTGFWWGEIPRWVWCGRVWERYCLKDVGLDGKMILKWIFKKWD